MSGGNTHQEHNVFLLYETEMTIQENNGKYQPTAILNMQALRNHILHFSKMYNLTCESQTDFYFYYLPGNQFK